MIDSANPRGNSIQVSELCSVLADEHSRQVISYFRSEPTDVATVDELAEHAVAPNDPATDWRRAAVLLHHKTLPKLADADILDYDPRQQDVRYTGHVLLETWLDQLHAGE